MKLGHTILILRSRAKRGVSKDEDSWFETRRFAALLTMRTKNKVLP